MEPGFKIAVISRSAEGTPHVEPSEQPKEKESVVEKPTPKVETKEVKKEAAPPPPPPPKAKGISSPPKPSEPQLPPKDRERRVQFFRNRSADV